ncbi:uncharacterized protein HRG_06224 [Hirsutella rhossiliensis]|uniref:Uncharacterized protein n=1 Tax=Hirsutella rhossiliensis TaxID=111463 RepID=A0A9P8MYS9_9HYPO|nr:uncharacterized protein HRG_06224 [Hirsutella rhossiliensis]KAH0963714.1 hypothetical protein HRG_06224 [Hirsutella rhossiliensis]
MAINVVETDANKDPAITYGDASKGLDVFSKPMRLTSPMTSTLVIQVKQDNASNADEGWQFDKYLKSVPRGLWSKYDPSTDPRNSDKNIGDLLKNDNGAMPLMMGVKFTSPKPTVSPDPFPAFKVADADLQRLFAKRRFPTMVDADAAWAPAKPFSGADVQKQYNAVYNMWTNPALGTDDAGQKGFVGLWQKA